MSQPPKSPPAAGAPSTPTLKVGGSRENPMQAALRACVDEMLHDGIPTDPYHPRRVALDAAEAALASRPDAQADEARAADPGEELQGWSVTVERNGVCLLTIENECVGGVDNIDDFAPLVRNCAEHLLSFIGRDTQADERGAFE